MFKFGTDKFSKKQLPKNFAEQILNLEMEVELNEQVQIEMLQDLISLYMVGVEYYESIKDRRYIYFQRKLNSLMVKPSFINTTTKIEEQNKHHDKEQDQSKLKRAKFEEESKRIELDLIYSQTESKEAQVKGIVENHTDCVKKIESLIQHEIAVQADSFQMRLEKRRRSKLTHSMSQPEIDIESQKSGNSNQKHKNEVQEQIIQIKQIIQEEDEITKEPCQKQEKKWELINNVTQKQRTNSIQNKRRSMLLTSKQLAQLLSKRSSSLTYQSNLIQDPYSKEQLFKDHQRIIKLFQK